MPRHPDRFVDRHVGPRDAGLDAMLRTLACRDLDDLIARAVPASIRFERELALEPPLSEVEAMGALTRMAGRTRCCAPTSAWAITERSCRPC